MLPVVVALVVIVVLFGFLVLGLLRSHADIIRALHTLGVGVGDPAQEPVGPQPVQLRTPAAPPLPAERSSAVHDLEGVTPQGDAVVVAMSSSPLNLLVFLTSGCSSCAVLWDALADGRQRRLLPRDTRVVVVTKGSEWESPGAIEAKAPEDTVVVMSTDAWGRYEIPGSPYFILVDGTRGVRIGEGVGQDLARIADMIGRAGVDEADLADHHSRSLPASLGLDGAEREAHNDSVLRAAGILPGDPSLYPRDLTDVFASTAPDSDERRGPE